MEDLSFFLKDIFCIDNIKDVTVDIIDMKNNCVVYDKIYAHDRIRNVLLVNFIFRYLFEINCPHSMTKLLLNKSIGDICKYMTSFTFAKYTTSQELFNFMCQHSETYNDSLRNSKTCKHELFKYIESRHGIKIENESLYQHYKQHLNTNYFTTNSNNITKDNYRIFNYNIFNNSINYDNLIKTKDNALIVSDCMIHNVIHDCFFARMMHKNIGLYVDCLNNANIQYISKILQYCENIPVILAPQVVIDELMNNKDTKCYNFVPFCIDKFEYLNCIPKTLFKVFISTRKYNMGFCNYIISDENIELSKNTFQLSTIYSTSNNVFYLPRDERVREVVFKLLATGNLQQVNGTDKILKYVENKKIEIELIIPKINKSSKNCIMIADNRENIMNVVSIIITLFNLQDNKWSVVFFGSNKAISYMKEIFRDSIEYIHEDRFEKKKFGIELYNDFMKDTKTWESLHKYEKCLVIQDDSAIIKRGLEDSVFMNSCDYVGPVWADEEYNSEIKSKCGHLCGNGGLSLRTIQIMKNITSTFKDFKNELFNKNLQPIPEDVFFAKYVKKVGVIMLNDSINKKFGCEQVKCMEAFGYHKVWCYNSIEFVNEFLK